MTPNLDEIRAALAAVKTDEEGGFYGFAAHSFLKANAPLWLACLCDEVERLNRDPRESLRNQRLEAEIERLRAVVKEYEATMQALNDIDDEWADQ